MKNNIEYHSINSNKSQRDLTFLTLESSLQYLAMALEAKMDIDEFQNSIEAETSVGVLFMFGSFFLPTSFHLSWIVVLC